MDDKWALALAVKLQQQQERKQLCRHKSSAPQKEKSKRPKCAAKIVSVHVANISELRVWF